MNFAIFAWYFENHYAKFLTDFCELWFRMNFLQKLISRFIPTFTDFISGWKIYTRMFTTGGFIEWNSIWKWSQIRYPFNNLKNKNSSGFQNVLSRVFEFISEYIDEHLAYLVNESIPSGIFPVILRLVEVILINKYEQKFLKVRFWDL